MVLTGAGDKAFCSGGDQKERGQGGYARLGRHDAQRPMDVEALHSAIRHIPKPVIAMVNGFAIGGGHVLHVLCDLSIAADTAIFGQTGPRVGSVDAGHGTGYLARVVGEKKAREIWYLCRQYSAQEALAMGLVNRVVPLEDLRAEVERWCAELLEKSPTALALAKQSFNIDSEPRAGVAQFAHTALGLYYETPEAHGGAKRVRREAPGRLPQIPEMTERTDVDGRRVVRLTPLGWYIIFNSRSCTVSGPMAGGLPLTGGMTRRGRLSFVGTPAGLALAALLVLASAVTSAENIPTIRPAAMVGDEMLRVFQEGKDAAEQEAPPEIGLGPAFDPQPAADFR